MTLHAIIIGEEAKKPLHYIQQANIIKGKGIENDRYFYGQGTFNKPQLSSEVREISLISYDALAQCNQRIEADLDFLDLRRNLVIKNMSKELKKDTIFTIGTATFKIVRTAPPCRYLSRLLGVDIMSGLKYIGGLRATILVSGIISVNDKVEIFQPKYLKL